jgi:hypothetical protein
VALVLLGVVGDRALDRVDQVHVAADLVAPGRAVGVLEVGHEAARAGVQRVDHELAVGRPGDLGAAVLVVRARRRDLPVGLADLARLFEEVERAAGAQRLAPLVAGDEQLVPAGPEAAMQLLDERHRVGRDDVREPVFVRGRDVQAHAVSFRGRLRIE